MIIKEKVVAIAISLQAFRLMSVYDLQTPPLSMRQMSVSRVAWRMVSAIQSASSSLFLILMPGMHHQRIWKTNQ